MTPARKIIWSEGALLTPQHFQYSEAYRERQLIGLVQSINPHSWGVVDCCFDESFFAQGLVKLEALRVLFKDLLYFELSETERNNLMVTIPDVKANQLGIYLFLPHSGVASGIAGYESEGDDITWRATMESLPDLFDSSRLRDVLTGIPNVQLVVGDRQPNAAVKAIKLAELTYDVVQKTHKLSASYTPPVLSIGASKSLTNYVQHFVLNIKQSIKLLSSYLAKQTLSRVCETLSDWQLAQLKSLLLTFAQHIDHQIREGQEHPYALYQLCIYYLSQLKGLTDSDLSEPFPSYVHADLMGTFSALVRSYDQLMSFFSLTDKQTLSLHRQGTNQFISCDLDIVALKKRDIILRIEVNTVETLTHDAAAALVKIAAPSDLNGVIHSFTQGLPIVCMSSKHNEAQNNNYWFRLEKKSAYWDAIIDEKRIAIFINQVERVVAVELFYHD